MANQMKEVFFKERFELKLNKLNEHHLQNEALVHKSKD